MYTIAQTMEIVTAGNGLKIQPDFDFISAPTPDILIIPGGYGAEEIEIYNQETINWIKQSAKNVKIIASVCTGAFLLAKSGLLNGRQARNTKFVDAFPIITSGGISAGINMSFYIVKKLLGVEIAKATAKRMEYDIDLKE